MKRLRDEPRRDVTLHDVAQRAGVSPMTVSRVVNGAPGVARATRDLVQRVVSELGFVPNRAARSLRARRSHWIALVFQRMQDEPAQREPAYVTELQEGVLRRCQESGYHAAVEVLSADAAQAVRQLGELAQQLAPDGMLLAPPLSSSPDILQLLRSWQVPVVRIAPRSETGDSPCVLMDDQAAAQQMTDHLLSLGHRRIGFVQGHPGHVASRQRLAGYKAALKAWEVPVAPSLIAPGDFTFEGGRRAAAQLLEAGGQRPTALFAANDELAAGCLAEAHQRGVQVPAELSICGFDDTYVATMLYPPLTTIRQSIREMGHAATGQLLGEIEQPQGPRVIRVPHQLVERQSAAPAPTARRKPRE